MIKKDAEINAIEKVQKDIDHQSLSNPKIVQTQLEYVAIIPKKKVKKISLILWLAIASGILFGIFNLITELVKNYQLDNAHVEPVACMGYKPKNGELPEAKQYVGSMNRAQQAKFAENSAFVNSVDELGLGMRTETTNYKYSINMANKAAFQYGIPKEKSLRGYVGAVFLIPANDGIKTVAILCLAKSSDMAKIADPTNINGQLACGDGTEIVTK